MITLRGMYGTEAVPAAPLFSHVTRWDSDPFSMGAYSYWKTGMQLEDVLNSARPEPEMASCGGESTTSAAHPRSEGNDSRYRDSSAEEGQDSPSMLHAPTLFFCGEHATIRDAQCVHGACNSGERAARQLSLAALGHMSDLDKCIRGGETFWYSEEAVVATPEETSPQGVEAFVSPGRSQGETVRPVDIESVETISSKASASSEKDTLSKEGKCLLFHPRYSPFPTPEAVRWQCERWLFACVCGVSGEGYDDGTSMIQCYKCGVWQHSSCVDEYVVSERKRGGRGTRDVTPPRRLKASSSSTRVVDLVNAGKNAQEMHICHICDASRFKSCPAFTGERNRNTKKSCGGHKEQTPVATSFARADSETLSFWDACDCADVDEDESADGDGDRVAELDEDWSDEDQGAESPIKRVRLTRDLVSHYAACHNAKVEMLKQQTSDAEATTAVPRAMEQFDEDDMNLMQVATCVEWERLFGLLQDTGSLLVDAAQVIMVSERERALAKQSSAGAIVDTEEASSSSEEEYRAPCI